MKSVRGLTDGTGALAGSADYDVFGSVRATSGAGSVLGFTGEQLDSETGYTYLRARYLNPTLGRFTSADTVQPNAPGTQGYNLYAYVANNPTTWTDPTGHYVPFAYIAAIATQPGFLAGALLVCAAPALALGVGTAAAANQSKLMALSAAGIFFGQCSISVLVGFTIPTLICYLDFECAAEAREISGTMGGYGSDSPWGTWDCCPFPPFDVPDIPGINPPDVWDGPTDTTGENTQTSEAPGSSGGGGDCPPFSSMLWFTTLGAKPTASNSKLKNTINELFREEDEVAGGTAGIIRQELSQGNTTGHVQKGQERVTNLRDILKNQQLDAADRCTAQQLLDDLMDALGSLAPP